MRLALADLKNGADLAASKEAPEMVEDRDWHKFHWFLKAGQGVGALPWWWSFEKANYISWTGASMTHVVALKSRSWALVLQAEDREELMCVNVKWVIDLQGGVHLEHQWKVHPLTILVDSVPVRGLYFQPCLLACCPPHHAWQCLWFPCEFLNPGCHEDAEEHSLGLVVSEQGWS